MGIWIFEMPLTFSTDHEQISGTFLPLTIMCKKQVEKILFSNFNTHDDSKWVERERERERDGLKAYCTTLTT